MKIVYPVKLDKPICVKDTAGVLHKIVEIAKADLAKSITLFNSAGVPVKVNGYDSSQNNNGQGTRVTNLVGTANGDLLKRCPRCEERKNQKEFGEEGRITRGLFRDQSHCNTCRPLASRKK